MSGGNKLYLELYGLGRPDITTVAAIVSSSHQQTSLRLPPARALRIQDQTMTEKSQ